MPVCCVRCRSTEIARIRRRGVLDQILAQFDRWPYRCLACAKSFRLNQRHVAGERSRSSKRRSPERTRTANADMAFRTDPVRPYAKIVVEADTHSQLDSILLALRRAVSSSQAAPEEHPVAK